MSNTETIIVPNSTTDELQNLVNDYITQKQSALMQMKRGTLGRSEFLTEAKAYIEAHYRHMDGNRAEELLTAFEQYIFGYSRLSPLIDDPLISDIRVVSFDNIRIKKEGKRQDAGIAFIAGIIISLC